MSHLERSMGETLPAGERYLGMSNVSSKKPFPFGLTIYGCDIMPSPSHPFSFSLLPLLLPPSLSPPSPPSPSSLLSQFGNTCYVNSVLQALYFCLPFRERVLEHRCAPGEQPETLLASLADLFDQIASSRKKFGILHPRKFVNKVKKENGAWLASGWRKGWEK